MCLDLASQSSLCPSSTFCSALARSSLLQSQPSGPTTEQGSGQPQTPTREFFKVLYQIREREGWRKTVGEKLSRERGREKDRERDCVLRIVSL